ncbi:kelch repeat protein, partial [Oesophagostomum dentatum]
ECEMPRGNADDAKITLDSVECFNLAKSTWIQMPPMNQKRSGLSLLATGDALYAIGGYCGTTPVMSMEIYRESTNKWELVNLPTAIHYAGVASVPMAANLLFDLPT